MLSATVYILYKGTGQTWMWSWSSQHIRSTHITYHLDPLSEGRKRKSIIQHYKLWQSAGVVDLSQNHSAMQLPRSIQMKFARAQPIATLFQSA